MKTWSSIIALLALLVLSIVPISADDAPNTYHHSGFMSDSIEEFTIKLALSEGQFIFAYGESVSDDLDPYLLLKDANGNILIENDDMNPDSLNALLGFYVEADGVYELVLSNIEGTSGDFSLTISLTSSAKLLEDFITESEWITFEEEITYEIELTQNQVVVFETEILEGDLDPFLFFIDPYGEIISWSDDIHSDDYNSYLVYLVPETGTYEIAMAAWEDTSGSFALSGQVFDALFAPFDPSPAPTIDVEQITNAVGQADDVVEGFVGGEYDTAVYTVNLDQGAGLIVRGESNPKVLDIIVRIYDEDENLLADSDDWSEEWHSVVAYFIAPETAIYYVEISAENNTQGDYVMTFEYAKAEDVMKQMRVELSGAHRTIETENFIIHYTTAGDDAISEQQAYFIADIMENVYDVQINDLGWYPPIHDGLLGGDDRYDVYIQSIYQKEDVLGYAIPENPAQDNPYSPHVEAYGMGGYLIVEGQFAGEEPEEVERLLISTLAHEFHHLIQFGYNATGDNWWYYEATATFMELVTIPPYNDALHYVEDVLVYPEICLGAMGDADPSGGYLMYGSWLFIQSLVDGYGHDALKAYWQNLAIHGHGWEALEITLAQYGTTIPDVVARYHVQNLALDYKFAPFFEGQDRVWVEGLFDDTGVWEMAGYGVQELGANYNLIDLPDGVYQFSLVDAPNKLVLYGVGIDTTNRTADVFNLGANGAVDVSGYDEFVLMTFNLDYHDELDNCSYEAYSVGIKAGGDALPVSYVMNAPHYLSLHD